MDGIILVGGFGTRLLPLTKTRPKPLIPVANIPFLVRAITWLRDEGVSRVILSLHYNAEQFITYFSQTSLGVDIAFALEDTPLGTGGAIKNCEPHLRAERCFIVNGDVFTNLRLGAMLEAHQHANARVSIALYEVDDPSRFGVIETDDAGSILSFTEKPPKELARSRDINAGVYIFEREVFDHFPSTPCSVERDIFPALLDGGLPMAGYREHPYWTDLGTPEDYLRAHHDILAGLAAIQLPGREIAPGVWAGRGTAVAQDARIIPPVLLGDEVRIAPGATIGPLVTMGNHVCVNHHASVSHSVLWDNVLVHQHCAVRNSILGQYVQVAGTADGEICEDYGAIGLPDTVLRAA